jgi:tetratricopeptide (TPR) repeat protein
MNRLIQACFPIISIFLFAVFSGGCNGSGNKDDDEASNLLKSPPYAALSDSIRRFPDNAGLYFRRAILLSQNKVHELALADYKKSWQLAPTEETGLRYAASLSIIGRPKEKISLLQDCIQKFPGEPSFERLLGEAYMEADKFKEAMELYDRLLQKDSADFEVWYEKGLALEQLKDTAGAIAALKRAFLLQPVNTYALELAHLYAESKNPVSLKICDEVIRRDSLMELADPFFIKGIFYANTSQYEQAITQFDSCIRRDWKFTDAYIEKGIAFFKQKNYDGALNTFRMAATVSNTYPDAYYWMGRCYEAINRKEEAILNYERAISLDKHFTEAKEALKRIRKS